MAAHMIVRSIHARIGTPGGVDADNGERNCAKGEPSLPAANQAVASGVFALLFCS